LLSSNISFTCPHNMVNFGPLAAEICWRVWGTPVTFNGFCVLAALLRGRQVVSVSQTSRVEQRAPPMFGRATIRLGIGPHSSSFFFSSHNLSRRRLDVCHTSTHAVALVQISDAGLKRAARGSLKIQDGKKLPKSPSGHHRTTLSGYIFATKARIGNRKKTC